jgi:hypothetical protein
MRRSGIEPATVQRAAFPTEDLASGRRVRELRERLRTEMGE